MLFIYIYYHYCAEPVHCTILGQPVHNLHRSCQFTK